MTALESGVLPRILTACAPAKVNLTLEILDTRPDGFHALQSFVIGVGLVDRLEVHPREGAGLVLECSDRALECPDNLALRAAELLSSRFSVDRGGLLRLEKSIPVGGGLGGGSSDAAAALRACNRAWDLGLATDALAELGTELGSDVPLFFHLPSAVMTGRGEQVRAMGMRWTGWVLLVHAGPVVSTADVYGAWRKDDAARRHVGPDRVARAATALELADLLVNDLERAVFRVCPRVHEVAEVLSAPGFGSFRVSGAGSTLFRLFDEKRDADEMGKRIENEVKGVAVAVVPAPFDPGDPEYNEEK